MIIYYIVVLHIYWVFSIYTIMFTLISITVQTIYLHIMHIFRYRQTNYSCTYIQYYIVSFFMVLLRYPG